VRDALVALGRVASTGSALLLDRCLPSGSARPPYSLAQLDTAWLSRALRARYPGLEVRAVELLDVHSGTTTRARVRLDYSARGSGPAPPELLFVKIAPQAPAQRLFAVIFGLGRNEVALYERLGDALPVRVPVLYGSACSGEGRRFALLLEDLTPTDARFAKVGDRASLEDARLVVDSLARLHAAYWESPRLGADLAFLPRLESRRPNMAWERFFTDQMLARARRRFADELPSEFTRAVELCVRQRNRLEELWARGDRTLVHGDCHIGNLFFEAREVGFFDWQVASCAPGMRDVSYFLCNSLPAELRGAHERELITRYLEGLKAGGARVPGWNEAWQQHRLYALYSFLAATFTAGAGDGLQPREVALAGVRRGTRAVAELETLALLGKKRI